MYHVRYGLSNACQYLPHIWSCHENSGRLTEMFPGRWRIKHPLIRQRRKDRKLPHLCLSNWQRYVLLWHRHGYAYDVGEGKKIKRAVFTSKIQWAAYSENGTPKDQPPFLIASSTNRTRNEKSCKRNGRFSYSTSCFFCCWRFWGRCWLAV